MGTFVRGSLAGVVGTAVMSLVITGARAGGLLQTPPPKQITEIVEQRASVRHRLLEPMLHASWPAAHLAYGIACGVLYALARQNGSMLERSRSLIMTEILRSGSS